MEAVGLVRVVGGDDVRMRQTGRRLDFLTKALDRRGLGQQAAAHDLQGDDALHQAMLGLEDDAHTAGADDAEDAIARVVRQFRRYFHDSGGRGARPLPAFVAGHRRFDEANEVVIRQPFQLAKAEFANGDVAFDVRPLFARQLAQVKGGEPVGARMRGVGGVHGEPLRRTDDWPILNKGAAGRTCFRGW